MYNININISYYLYNIPFHIQCQATFTFNYKLIFKCNFNKIMPFLLKTNNQKSIILAD